MIHEIELRLPFDAAVERAVEALTQEEFGIISRIELHENFKQKLGEEIPPHTILGACNPRLAFRAVSNEPKIATLLPCNVTVQSRGKSRSIVRIVNAREIMMNAGLRPTKALSEVAEDADARLRRVADSLRGTG